MAFLVIILILKKIETLLNGYAEQGWELKAVGRNEFPGFGGKRDEIVLFLERERN